MFIGEKFIEEFESPIVRRIKETLNKCGGKTSIPLLQGGKCEIWFDPSDKGLISSKIPLDDRLSWEDFEAAVEVVINNAGRARKGNARSGAKLGSPGLELNSVEGYIAYKVHGVQRGETTFGPGFVICAVLDWVGICKNERGYLSINPLWLLTVPSLK